MSLISSWLSTNTFAIVISLTIVDTRYYRLSAQPISVLIKNEKLKHAIGDKLIKVTVSVNDFRPTKTAVTAEF